MRSDFGRVRLLCSMLVLFSLGPGAPSQTPSDKSDGSNVTVLEKKWRIDVRNPKLERDPVAEMNDRDRAERARIATQRSNDILGEQGMPAPTTTVPDANRAARAGGVLVTYVYELKFTNTAAKTIRTLIWEYVFFETGTETEVGRRRFVSKVNVGPGKTTNLTVRALAAPTKSIAANQAGKKPREQYSEQIVIQSVQYDDGSMWRLKSN